MGALETITPDIEIFSVDEAFLDLTRCQRLYGVDAWAIGQRIKRVVFETSELLCSVGARCMQHLGMELRLQSPGQQRWNRS